MEDFSAREAMVDHLVQEKKTGEAVDLLYDLIVDYAREKDFLKADGLREKLMAVDPMALQALHDTAEVIETEKAGGIDKRHLESWQDLYGIMTEEEKIAFYYSLKELRAEPGDEVIVKGRLNNRLYLMDSGRLKIITGHGERETFVDFVEEGEIVGEDTFFPISVSTIGVLVERPALLNAMDRNDLDRIERQYPGFETKLEEFCRKRQNRNIADILKERGCDRRQHQRYQMAGRVYGRLIDREDNPVGEVINGTLEDLSAGGGSFLIKCSRKQTARRLLGRKAFFTLFVNAGGKEARLQNMKGIVLSVLSHHFNEYSLHIRFARKIKEEDLRRLDALQAE